MKIWTKPLVKNAKRPLPVDVHRSKNVFSVRSLLALAALKHGNIIILICHELSRLHVYSPSFWVVKSEENNVSQPITITSFLMCVSLSL